MESVSQILFYNVNLKDRRLCYYCVVGIYPKWAIFIDTIFDAVSKMKLHFASAQEGLRKDFERAFGVLLSIWNILKHPCLFCDRSIMTKVVKVAIVAERALNSGSFIDYYGQYKPFMWNTREKLEEALNVPLSDMEWAASLATRDDRNTDKVGHYGLKHDMVCHVWRNWELETKKKYHFTCFLVLVCVTSMRGSLL